MNSHTTVNETDAKLKPVASGPGVVFALVCAATCVLLMASGFLHRQELQTINQRFEGRMWLRWSPEGFARLNPSTLWQYHEEHETPKQLWAWDYTLSWLIEDNHPEAANKIVIFNRMQEDEPPAEAIQAHPWMAPLKQYPISRRTIADIIRYLHNAGARMIILDNDFPQYSSDDSELAQAIHESSASTSAPATPVIFATTIGKRETGNLFMEELPTVPYGLMKELSKLDGSISGVADKFAGSVGVISDEDQEVRQTIVRFRRADGTVSDSIAAKALRKLGRQTNDIPDIIDIDFVAPPNSKLYPVRPLWYLLDPRRRAAMMASPQANQARHGSADVNVRDAIVVIGDGIVDVLDTPLTNQGVNQMSGSEILVHGLETMARRSWPHRLDGRRLDGPISMLYGIFLAIAGGALWTGWKSLQRHRLSGITVDLLVIVAIVAAACFTSLLLFAYASLLVPVVVPALALGLGGLAAVLWERDRAREHAFQVKLQAANERLKHAEEKYETDLRRQEAEAKAREILADQKLRKEFVRRINHDLNAPVSVLNWTLAELEEEGLESAEAKEKLSRLVKNSDKLCELIDQMVQTYDYEAPPGRQEVEEDCDINQLLSDCVELQQPLAQIRGSTLSGEYLPHSAFVKGGYMHVSRIVDNLIRNALKHNPPGTNVTASLSNSGSTYKVSILDTGKGIECQHLERIFEAGYRADAEASEGQGLGLDIVRQLVEEIHGTIAVESELGKGTTFTLTLMSSDSSQAKSRE